MASDEGLVAQAAPSTPAVSVLEPAADAGAHGGAAEQSRFMLLSSCESIFQTFSGPAQYLQANLKEPCDVVDFRNWLRNTFPEAEDTLYSADEKLPKVPAASQDYACQQPLCIHVSALGFTGDCTLKPPPGGEFCKCLLEEILMDGFQSASDPLLVLQHEPDCAPLDLPCGDHGQLRAFSLAYVKGYTRAVTLLTALHRCKVLGLDGRTDEGLKPLWNSVTKVFVHCVEQRGASEHETFSPRKPSKSQQHHPVLLHHPELEGQVWLGRFLCLCQALECYVQQGFSNRRQKIPGFEAAFGPNSRRDIELDLGTCQCLRMAEQLLER